MTSKLNYMISYGKFRSNSILHFIKFFKNTSVIYHVSWGLGMLHSLCIQVKSMKYHVAMDYRSS
jgi:hypothetical protein